MLRLSPNISGQRSNWEGTTSVYGKTHGGDRALKGCGFQPCRKSLRGNGRRGQKPRPFKP
jgi:hypothetical protein